MYQLPTRLMCVGKMLLVRGWASEEIVRRSDEFYMRSGRAHPLGIFYSRSRHSLVTEGCAYPGPTCGFHVRFACLHWCHSFAPLRLQMRYRMPTQLNLVIWTIIICTLRRWALQSLESYGRMHITVKSVGMLYPPF